MNLLQLPRSQREGVNIHATQRIALEKLHTSDVMSQRRGTGWYCCRRKLKQFRNGVRVAEVHVKVDKRPVIGRLEKNRIPVYFVPQNNSEDYKELQLWLDNGWLLLYPELFSGYGSSSNRKAS